MAILLGGIVSGLLVSGFFGTFDNPSQRAINIMHSMGIDGLKEFKNIINGVMRENIEIPIIYIKGKLSNPKKIFIDIDFEDYQKIRYKRQQALDSGVLICSGEDYVPAKIRYKDKELKVKLRLKGDNLKHLNSDKWSFRIKIKGDDTLFGIKTFSIQHPRTRGYINELIYHHTLRKESVMSPRYDFIEVIINGENKGIYALEEHFDKELIEYNNRREGVIIKFGEDLFFDEKKRAKDYFSNDLDLVNYMHNKLLDFFYSSNIKTFNNKKILEDPILSKQFKEAKNLLELFRNCSLKTSEVFDVDKFSKYFAITTLMGAAHGSNWGNIGIYYNPITSRLEPIGYDAGVGGEEAHEIMELYFPDCLLSNENNCSQGKIDWWNLIFRDKVFFEKYMQELERVSQKSYLDNLFLELDEEIKRDINIIHKDELFYHFSTEVFYINQQQIKNILDPVKAMNVYFDGVNSSQNKIILSIGNINPLPLEIVNLVYDDSIIFEPNQINRILQPKALSNPVNYQKFEFRIPDGFEWDDSFVSSLKLNYKILGLKEMRSEEIFPRSYIDEEFLEKDFIRQKPNFKSFDFLDVDEDLKSIFIKKGVWVLNQSLIIPEGFNVFCYGGTTIDLVNNSTILSYSNLQFSGTEKDTIKIISSDRTGQGLTVLNANKISNLRYVIFKDLTNPSKEGWELTGAVTFYDSPFKFNNVKILNMNSEDSLNIVNSKFEIKNSGFENCFYDCIDDDFGEGVIESSSFTDCGNDCIDVSGSEVDIKNIDIFNAGDKGVSAGENCSLNLENLKINGGFIGIASKDKSNVFAKDIEISNVKYGFAVYQKKLEFGPASINAVDVSILFSDNRYIIEKKSNLKINDIVILSAEEEVYKKLYGEN